MTGANQAGPAAAGPGGPSSLRQLWRYLVRHWRGELSLRDAGWRSGLLGYVLLLSPAATFLLLCARFAPDPIGLLGEPLAWLVALPLVTWHLGGLWRSATRIGGARPAAALLTRGAVLLALLATIDLLWVRAVPQAREAFDIALRGDPRIGPHLVRLLPGGTELEVSGGLTAGVAAEVEAQLAAAPEIRVIHLNSPGGRISEGIALEAVIRRHGLATYVSTACASACTLAFLGGRRRWMGPSAALGFHRPGPYPGSSRAEDEDASALLEAEMRQAGLAGDFVARVIATPFETLWQPTADELLESGVVTDLSDGTQFAFSGYEDGSAEGVERSLVAYPALAALRTLDGAAFRRLRTAYAAALAEGRSQHDVWQRFIQELGPIALRHLPEASDEALAATASFWIEALATGGDRVGCDDLLAGTLDGTALRTIGELSSRYADAMALVLQSAAAGHPPAPDPATAQEAMAALGSSVGVDEAALVRLQAPGGAADPAACRMRAELFRAALALPGDRRAAALRALVSH